MNLYIYIYIYIYNELKVYIAIRKKLYECCETKELKELELLRESEINEIENATKIKLNILNDETDYILEDLEFELKHGTLKNRYFKRLIVMKIK